MIYPNKFKNLKIMDRCLQGACYAAFSLAILFLAGSIYHAIRRDRFSKTPAQLTEASQSAENNIAKQQPLQIKVEDIDAHLRLKQMPLDEEPYRTGVWYPPLWNDHRRASPELYPVQSLLASAGHGAFTVHSRPPAPLHPTGLPHGIRGNPRPDANASLEGYRWIIVTGIIEYRRQIEAYQTALDESSYRQPEFDLPDYRSFAIERAEITDDTADEKLDWQPRPIRSMYDMKNRWSQLAVDPVEAKYFPPSRDGLGLVFPLGPLAAGRWSEEVGHPRIAKYESELRKKIRAKLASATIDAEESFESPAPVSPMAWPRPAGSPWGPGEISASAEKADILLVRYIDYEVEPGKKYRYRLKLIVQNPNWKVPAKYLQSPDLSDASSLETGWSRPTPVVSVPSDTEIQLLAVDGRHGRAIVKLIHFDLATGRNQSHEFQVERGELLNYYNQEYYPQDSASTESEMPSLFATQTKPPPAQLVDYVTGMTLIDFHASGKQPDRQVARQPSSITLMDRDGKLSILEECESKRSLPSKIPSRQLAATPRSAPAD